MRYFRGFLCKSKWKDIPGQTHTMLQSLHIPSVLVTHAFEDMTIKKDIWAIHLHLEVYSKRSWMGEQRLKSGHKQLSDLGLREFANFDNFIKPILLPNSCRDWQGMRRWISKQGSLCNSCICQLFLPFIGTNEVNRIPCRETFQKFVLLSPFDCGSSEQLIHFCFSKRPALFEYNLVLSYFNGKTICICLNCYFWSTGCFLIMG